MKTHLIHSSLLRGGFCALWIFGFAITFYQFLAATTADMGSAEQNADVLHMCICAGIGIVSAAMHAYLIHEATNSRVPKD